MKHMLVAAVATSVLIAAAANAEEKESTAIVEIGSSLELDRTQYDQPRPGRCLVSQRPRSFGNFA
jgi:hypothetical protein